MTDVECARLSHQLWSILVSFVQSRSNYFLRALNDALVTPQTPATPVSDAGFGRTNNRSEWHPAARLLLHTHVPKSEFHRCMYSYTLSFYSFSSCTTEISSHNYCVLNHLNFCIFNLSLLYLIFNKVIQSKITFGSSLFY